MLVPQGLSNNKKETAPVGKRRSSLLSANLSRQTFLMLMGVEAAILSLIGFFFFIQGANKELGMVRADLTVKQQEAEQLIGRLDNFLVLNKLYESLDEKTVAKVKQVLPAAPDLPDLMINLDTLVKNNGFSLTSIDFQIVNDKGEEVFRAQNAETARVTNAEVGQNLTENGTTQINKELKIINISIDIKGSSYGGLKNLISQLENNLRLFDVLKFGFSGDSNSLKIDLRAYYL
jgi:hypothetical protein